MFESNELRIAECFSLMVDAASVSVHTPIVRKPLYLSSHFQMRSDMSNSIKNENTASTSIPKKHGSII